MNWKKVLHSAICLLVVCAILLTMVPVKAKATSAGIISPGGTIVEMDLSHVVAAIIMGLGVAFGYVEDPDLIFDSAYQELFTKNLIDNFDKIKVFMMDTASGACDFIFGVSSEIIEAIRSWLFDSGTVSLVSSGFSGTSQSFGYYFNLLPSLKSCNFPVWDYLRYAYENDQAVVVSAGATQFQGFYFDEYGDLNVGVWENPYGEALAKYCGLYSLSEITLIDSYDGGHVFATENAARLYPAYSSSNCYVIDWEKNGSFFSSTSQYSFPFYGYYKKSGDEIFETTSASYTFYTGYDSVGGYGGNFGRLEYKYYMTSFDAFADDVIVSGAISSGIIAHPDESLDEGYPVWYGNSVTVPGSSVGLGDEEEVTIFPIGYGTSFSDVQKLTQSDVWTGSTVSSNTNTNSGTASDSIANVGADTFWDKLVAVITTPFEWLADTVMTGIKSIFVPSEDFVSAKVDALSEKFPFITPVVTLARTISLNFDDVDSTPPIIYLHLEDSRGSYYLGETVPFIDMTWYAEYKPIGDALLSSLLWVFFIWRLFRQLPGIISGMPGDFNAMVLDKLHIDMPHRDMSGDYQRLANREVVKEAYRNDEWADTLEAMRE